MAYPAKLGKDVETMDGVIGKDLPRTKEPEVAPLPKTNPLGGAPKLPESPLIETQVPLPRPSFTDANRPLPAIQSPTSAVPGKQSTYMAPWRRTQVQPPDREVLYPASPWTREEIDTNYGDLIEQVASTLWKRYQTLPAEQKALGIWQQVGMNAQEAARSMVVRVLMGRSNLSPRTMNEEQRKTTAESNLFRWFRFLQEGWE